MPPTDEKCPLPTPIEQARARGGRLLFALIIIPMLLALWLGWQEADAAVVGTPYWRVTLNQGVGAIGYGQGPTSLDAWNDCDRLAKITRAMTAAETRRNAVGAISSNTVRWCSGPAIYYTVAPDPVTCPPPPASRPGTCPTGTTGSWTQTASVGPSPACTVTWSTAPVGACVPIDNTPIPPNAAELTWQQGGDLTNLKGYKIVYGSSPNLLPRQVDIPGTARSFVIPNLTPGTYYFAMISKGPCSGTQGSAVDPYVCQDSWLSNVVSKVVR